MWQIGYLLKERVHALRRVGTCQRDMKRCVEKLPVRCDCRQDIIQDPLAITDQKNFQLSCVIPLRIKGMTVQKAEK